MARRNDAASYLYSLWIKAALMAFGCCAAAAAPTGGGGLPFWWPSRSLVLPPCPPLGLSLECGPLDEELSAEVSIGSLRLDIGDALVVDSNGSERLGRSGLCSCAKGLRWGERSRVVMSKVRREKQQKRSRVE